MTTQAEVEDYSLVYDLLRNLRSCNLPTLDISLLCLLKLHTDNDKSHDYKNVI
jgi:hypothetical protein